MPPPTAADLTIPEAAEFLEPRLSQAQWRLLVRLAADAGLAPVGRRHSGAAGRPFPTYPAAVLIRLHGAIAPVLVWIERQVQLGELPDTINLDATPELAPTGTDT